MAANPSYAQGATDIPLIEQTLGAFFDDMVEKQPDHEALVSRHEGQRFTYRELQSASNRLASALLKTGLQPGDRVGIWSHNNAPWILMQIATAKVGLVLVNINPAYRTSEVEYALNKVGCKALVLATCGFGANHEMVKRFIPDFGKAANYRYFGHEGNEGEGIEWGMALGGGVGSMDAFQGYGALAEQYGIIVNYDMVM